MRVAIFDTKPYDRRFFDEANDGRHDLVFFEPRLSYNTAKLALDFPAICVFVHDSLDTRTVKRLSEGQTRLIALRSAGFNNVDLGAAHYYKMTVVRVPAYSPHSIAEHTVGLLLALNRRLHRAYNRVREGNFALEGLLGFDLHGKTVGIVGTGKIGTNTARILCGFGCNLLAFDPYPNPVIENELCGRYVDLDELLSESDVVSLHVPLTPDTQHLIGRRALNKMKEGAILINTSRGQLIDTAEAIDALKDGRLGGLGLDVYEEEDGLFFEDLSNQVIQDDVFARLLTFPNVIVTAHQAFFTAEALQNIAKTTLDNISEYEETGSSGNAVSLDQVKA
ncbi:MAG: 2-hydroxyacid dehydrogenase [Chloroflexi bacterium]|nr:2-hydroxyacid dehydrogenase [Chloroflexota bacterium]